VTRRLCPVRFGWRGVSLAQQVVLAHPTKLRIITEGKRKRDPLDAQVLAEFLESDESPLAYRPCPRVRDHRAGHVGAGISRRAFRAADGRDGQPRCDQPQQYPRAELASGFAVKCRTFG
jgi:hypothetical protein